MFILIENNVYEILRVPMQTTRMLFILLQRIELGLSPSPRAVKEVSGGRMKIFIQTVK